MSKYKLVPVELLKDWHERINTIAAEMAFNVADEMESMLDAAPDVSALVEALELAQGFLRNKGRSEDVPFLLGAINAALAAMQEPKIGRRDMDETTNEETT